MDQTDNLGSHALKSPMRGGITLIKSGNRSLKITLAAVLGPLVAACADPSLETTSDSEALVTEQEATEDVVRTPAIVVAGEELPVDVELAAGRVYWANAIGVFEGDDSPRPIRTTSKLLGGPVTTVAVAPPFLGNVEVDAERVYWSMGGAAEGVGGLQSMPKGGGPIADLIANTSVFQFVVGGDDVFAATPDGGGQILKVPASGGPVEVLAAGLGAGLGNTPSMALSGDRVFFSTSTFEVECDGQVSFVPRAGGGIVTVARDICGLLAIEADRRAVYWTEFDPAEAIGRVVQLTAPFTGAPTVLASFEEQPLFLALDAANIYYATFSPIAGTGEIGTVRKDGCGQRVLAAEQLFPSSLAVDLFHVYWTTLLDGEVKRVPR